jgi:hypothetical protein
MLIRHHRWFYVVLVIWILFACCSFQIVHARTTCKPLFKKLKNLEDFSVDNDKIVNTAFDEKRRRAVVNIGNTATLLKINLITRKVTEQLRLDATQTTAGFLDQDSGNYYCFGVVGTISKLAAFLYLIDVESFQLVGDRIAIPQISNRLVACAVYYPKNRYAFLGMLNEDSILMFDVNENVIMPVEHTINSQIKGACGADYKNKLAFFTSTDRHSVVLTGLDMEDYQATPVVETNIFQTSSTVEVYDFFGLRMTIQQGSYVFIAIYDKHRRTEHAVIRYNIKSHSYRSVFFPIANQVTGLLLDTVNNLIYIFASPDLYRYDSKFKGGKKLTGEFQYVSTIMMLNNLLNNYSITDWSWYCR